MRAVNSLYNEWPKETTTARHTCKLQHTPNQTKHTDNNSVSAQRKKNVFPFFLQKSGTFRYIEYEGKRWKKNYNCSWHEGKQHLCEEAKLKIWIVSGIQPIQCVRE